MDKSTQVKARAGCVFFFIELAARHGKVRWHDRRAPGAFHLFFPFSPDSTLFPDVPNPSASNVAADGVGTSLVVKLLKWKIPTMRTNNPLAATPATLPPRRQR